MLRINYNAILYTQVININICSLICFVLISQTSTTFQTEPMNLLKKTIQINKKISV